MSSPEPKQTLHPSTTQSQVNYRLAKDGFPVLSAPSGNKPMSPEEVKTFLSNPDEL